MVSAIYIGSHATKNVPPPQEECVNVKQSYFKHTFKEPTAQVIKLFFLSNLSLSEQEIFCTFNMLL